MTIQIKNFVLGPIENNSYLIGDSETRLAVVIDPSFGAEEITRYAKQESWQINQIWLTHGHFDHFAGVDTIIREFNKPIRVGLHKADLPLWKNMGGAKQFGLTVVSGPEPSMFFEDGQILQVGESSFEVIHTPGHSPGHVCFYNADAGVLFCGDLIFQNGIGRTDLEGGSIEELMRSIHVRVMVLPQTTRLLCGHGPETTVEQEQEYNPFLAD